LIDYKLTWSERYYIPTGVEDAFDYGYDVVSTRLLIRGKGKALRIRFKSENGKDFQLLGWAMPYTAEETP
jgi:hypothetical protein